MATTDGSDRAMPSPRTYTSVLAVPRSMAMSRPPKPLNESNSPIRSQYPGQQYRYVVAEPRLRSQHGLLDLPREVVGRAGRHGFQDLGQVLGQQHPLRRAR